MTDPQISGIFGDISSILGFGFIGLAFIMAFLAYSALSKVISATNPRNDVIKLARIFMFMSLAFLVCAGPLHFGLLWAQRNFSAPTPINVTIGLANTNWQTDQYGEVGIMKGGRFIPFSSEALQAKFADGDELNIQLDKVIDIMRLMRAQLTTTTQATAVSQGEPLPPTPETINPADAAINGG